MADEECLGFLFLLSWKIRELAFLFSLTFISSEIVGLGTQSDHFFTVITAWFETADIPLINRQAVVSFLNFRFSFASL